MNKTVRITNKYRFIAFVTICVLLMSMVIGALFPVRASESTEISYTEVKIHSGDTLWSLARQYGDQSKDVREVVYDICQLNNVTAGSIYPGQTIRIPD